LWCNERNGRQSIEDFLSQIPLDRVWEVHVAGGFERAGYWLDAHSGAAPIRLMDVVRRVLPRLPNLRAVIFEVLPEHLPNVGMAAVRQQLVDLQHVWRDLPARPRATRPRALRGRRRSVSDSLPPPAWEAMLGALVTGQAAPGLDPILAADPGIALYRDLANSFRGAALVTTLPLACVLLREHLGRNAFRGLVEEFWQTVPPQPFARDEARSFAAFLGARGPRLELLGEVLAFDEAILDTLADGATRYVPFPCEPSSALAALSAGALPAPWASREHVAEISIEAARAWTHSRSMLVPLEM
jgi:hypothetical protein